MIAFVDVETTGFDVSREQLLEVGIALTDEHFEIRDRMSIVLAETRGLDLVLSSREDQTVYEMHTANSLLAEAERALLDREDAMFTLIRWAQAVADAYGEPLNDTPFAGSTVGFDRSFLAQHMRILEMQFHYRSIDVSSLKILNAIWGFAEPWESGQKRHRVDPDIDDSIAELKHYRAAIAARATTRKEAT